MDSSKCRFTCHCLRCQGRRSFVKKQSVLRHGLRYGVPAPPASSVAPAPIEQVCTTTYMQYTPQHGRGIISPFFSHFSFFFFSSNIFFFSSNILLKSSMINSTFIFLRLLIYSSTLAALIKSFAVL